MNPVKNLADAYLDVECSFDIETAWESLNSYFSLSEQTMKLLLNGDPITRQDSMFLDSLYPDSLNLIEAALKNLQKANDDLNTFIEMGKAALELSGQPSYILGDESE